VEREPLRVLHCLWDGETGGAERAVYQLVGAQLESERVEPAIAFAQGHGPYWEAARALDCPVVDLGLPHGHSFGSLPKVARAIRGHAIHHFHSAEPLLMSASLACRSARRVYTHRGGITNYPLRKRLQYRATGAVLRRGFHAFSGNTAHAAACAAKLFGIEQRRFAVTYNGIDFTLLEPRIEATAVRDEFRIAPAEFVLGTAANLRRWKRIDCLLRLLVHPATRGIRLLILGDGPDRGRLEGIAEELGLGNRAIFAGVQRHVGDYLQVMDAFCLPSTGLESFGNAAVEAMAAGIPTIVFTDGGGLLEHVEPGVTGFAVTDEGELRSVVSRLVEDEVLRERIGSSGQEATRAKYTLAHSTQRFESLYMSALQDSPDEPSTSMRAEKHA
jgi:glycosyltransferase involved in cell wall biosynthesis